MAATVLPSGAARRRRGRSRSAALLAKRRVQLALAILVVVLLALLAIGLLGAVVLYRSAEDRYVRVALPLQTLNRDVLFRLTEEETGVRGYMLTTERRSLTPYFEGRRALAGDLVQIRKLTRGRPKLATQTREVERQAEALRAFYDKLITFVADSREGRARAALDVLDAELRAAEFRRTLGLMQDDVDAYIADAHAAQHRTYVATLAMLGLAGALALLISIALLRRVPERLRLAYAEQEQGAQASRALAHVSEAVFLVDPGDTIRFWNHAAEQLWGVAEADALGRDVRSVVVDYDELLEASDHDDRFVPVLLENEERWLSPVVREFDGGTVATVRDATAAYTLERARTDFVATASHELRTPLTAVYGGATTLLARGEQLTASQRDRLLRLITQESEHLNEIVDQLLVSAQLDRGTLHASDEECDVAAICRAVVDAAQLRTAPGTVVALERSTLLAPIRCDATLLRQVVSNLVDNALKYSSRDVLVRVTDATASVRIDVADRGSGIPAAAQARIFEKFFRLDADMASGVGGSGLGLYISREIVEQLGGTLTVESRVGHGSTFSVTLPRRA